MKIKCVVECASKGQTFTEVHYTSEKLWQGLSKLNGILTVDETWICMYMYDPEIK